MEDSHDLVLAVFAVVAAAVMLVVGELYLVTHPGKPETSVPPPPIVRRRSKPAVCQGEGRLANRTLRRRSDWLVIEKPLRTTLGTPSQ